MGSGGGPTRGPAAGLLARAPSPGRALARLAPALDRDDAARLASAMLLDAVAAVRASRGWTPVIFAEPPASAPDLAALTGVDDARPQAAGDPGRRTLAALRALAADGHAPIAVVAADAPLLAPAHLDAARAALREADVVFGPAADGGYYLAAMWEPWPELFEHATIEWSGTRALATIERIAAARGTRLSKLAMERTVASPADLDWLRARLAALAERGEPTPARTSRLLRELGAASARPSLSPSGSGSLSPRGRGLG